MEPVLANISVVTKADVKLMVENRLTKRTSTLQLQIVKVVKSLTEDAL